MEARACEHVSMRACVYVRTCDAPSSITSAHRIFKLRNDLIRPDAPWPAGFRVRNAISSGCDSTQARRMLHRRGLVNLPRERTNHSSTQVVFGTVDFTPFVILFFNLYYNIHGETLCFGDLRVNSPGEPQTHNQNTLLFTNTMLRRSGDTVRSRKCTASSGVGGVIAPPFEAMAGVHEMSLPFKKRKAMGLAVADATLAKAVRVCMCVCVRVCVCASCVRTCVRAFAPRCPNQLAAGTPEPRGVSASARASRVRAGLRARVDGVFLRLGAVFFFWTV